MTHLFARENIMKLQKQEKMMAKLQNFHMHVGSMR